ncbi:MAG: leucyl aminopeptidase, partial [Lachnospiraceae bacterium]|nr:leucyl aminopeptidase [Lachnospiraceae bacterium]
TCYSREEDIRTCNPDGRELIAKDNEHTLKYRKSEPVKAYYNCHTDITIPYEELGEIASVDKDGERHCIIKDGAFAVPGAEDLNTPLNNLF